MKVYKLTDKIKVSVKEVIPGPKEGETRNGAEIFAFWISPLSTDQKGEIAALQRNKEGRTVLDGLRALRLGVKFSLKGISGLENADGSPWTLETEEGTGYPTDACVDELLNMERGGMISLACASLVRGVYARLTDDEGKDLDGVEVELPGAGAKK